MAALTITRTAAVLSDEGSAAPGRVGRGLKITRTAQVDYRPAIQAPPIGTPESPILRISRFFEKQ